MSVNREYMEILIVARDLASGDVASAQQRIDSALQKARQSARDAERDFSHLDQTERDLARAADQLGLSMERSGQGIVLHKRAAQESDAALGDLGRTTRAVEGDVGRLASALDRNTDALTRNKSASKDVESGLAGLAKTAGLVAGALPLGGAAMVGIGQAAAGAVGGIVSLGAALSQLSSLAVALPAAMASVGGSLLAIKTIAGPALDPVMQAIQAQDKLTAPGAPGAGGGGGGGGGGTGGAPSQLQQMQVTQAWQMQALEQQLHQLRVTNAQQEAQAQAQLNQARISAVQNVITLERQLHALKASNAAQEEQLRQSVADAQASAAEEAKTGGDHAAIAAGLVSQAQDNLTQFQAQAQQQQQQAQDAVDQAKLQGIQSVRSAEQNLQQVRVQNAQQLDQLQTQIEHTRIQNQWAIQQAQAAQAQAAGATTAAQSQQLALLKSMTPVQRELYNTILKIKDAWETLTEPGRAAFLQTALSGARAVQRGLPTIAGVENQFSTQLAGVGQDAIRQFQNPQLDARMTAFMQQMARDTGQLGKAAVDVLVAFTNFMTAPATRQFLQWLSDGVSGIGKWAKNEERLLEQHHHLADFFQSSEGVIRNTGRIIHDIADILHNIFSASAPTGRTLLGALADFLDGLDRRTSSRSGMAALRQFFERSGPEAAALASAVVTIAGALASLMAASQGAPPILVWAVTFLQWLSKVPDIGVLVGIGVQLGLMAKFIPGVGPALGLIVSGLGKLVGGLLVRAGIEFGILAAGADGAVIGVTALGASLGVILGVFVVVAAGLVLLYEAWTHNWLGIRDKVHEVWDWIVRFVKSSWGQGILLFLTGGLSELVKLFIDNWGKIEQVFRDVWNLLGDIVHGRWSNIIQDVENLGGDLLKVMSGIWNDLKKDAGNAWGAILRTAGTFVNDLIDVWNWVVTHIGLDSLKIGHVTWAKSAGSGAQSSASGFTGPGPPRLAAGGFVPAMPGGVALVSEAGHDELVVTTDPAHMSRSMQLILEWMERMGMMPRFDVGGWLSSVGSDIAGGAEAAWGAAKNVAGLVTDPVSWIRDHIPKMPSIAGDFGAIAVGMFDQLASKTAGFLEQKATSFVSFGGGGGGPQPTGPVPPQLINGMWGGINWGHTTPQAMAHGFGSGGVGYAPGARQLSAGQAQAVLSAALHFAAPSYWNPQNIANLMRVAQGESGFNTGIENQNDSNWAAGIPSIGFMQTIWPTFMSHAVPPYTNILDPFDNAVAAIRYMLSTYHTIIDHPGYASGGWVTPSGPRGPRMPRLAAGGWAKAANAMMSAPASGYGGALTSLAIRPGMAAAGGGARMVHIDMPIYTNEVAPDADYVARTLEMRLRAMP